MDVIFTQTTIGVPGGENAVFAGVEIMLHVGRLAVYPAYGPGVEKNRGGDLIHKLRRANGSKHVDEQTFYDLTIRLAEVADDMEKQVSDSDRH